MIDFLNKRNLSLMSIINQMVQVQTPYLLQKKPLQPLLLKDIATHCNLHVSTVSRIIKDKYFLFQNQVYPLYILFSKKTKDGSSLDQVKQFIDTYIKKETRALSDQQLYTLIKSKGIQCSRRAISKYRSELGYPSSYERNKNKERPL